MINLEPAAINGCKLLPFDRSKSARPHTLQPIALCLGLLAHFGNPAVAAEPKRLSDQEYVDQCIAWRQPRDRLLAISLDKFVTEQCLLRITTRHGGGGFTITISDADGEIDTWSGGWDTPVCICDDRIYYADYGPDGPGGHVVAVDVKARKVLWRSEIRGLGKRPHFAYYNRIDLSLELGNRNLVYIFGSESAGKYVEAKSLETGETVAHKRISEDDEPGLREAAPMPLHDAGH